MNVYAEALVPGEAYPILPHAFIYRNLVKVGEVVFVEGERDKAAFRFYEGKDDWFYKGDFFQIELDRPFNVGTAMMYYRFEFSAAKTEKEEGK